MGPSSEPVRVGGDDHHRAAVLRRRELRQPFPTGRGRRRSGPSKFYCVSIGALMAIEIVDLSGFAFEHHLRGLT